MPLVDSIPIPAPICERGGPKFQGRQRVSKDAFNFQTWFGLGTLETLGTHPPFVRFGTRKQLMKHLGLSDWLKFYLTILDIRDEVHLQAQSYLTGLRSIIRSNHTHYTRSETKIKEMSESGSIALFYILEKSQAEIVTLANLEHD